MRSRPRPFLFERLPVLICKYLSALVMCHTVYSALPVPTAQTKAVPYVLPPINVQNERSLPAREIYSRGNGRVVIVNSWLPASFYFQAPHGTGLPQMCKPL